MKRFNSCIIFLADGARADVTEEMLSAGKLPNIQKYVLEDGTYTRAVTAFPSTTGPAYLPFLTGCFPGSCNLPGIRWFDRERYFRQGLFSLYRFRSYIGPGNYLMNRDIDKDRPTLFEIADNSVNIFSSLSRGAGFWGKRVNVLKAFFWVLGHFAHPWPIVDKTAARLLEIALRRRPDFVYAVFPAIDGLSHIGSPFSQEVLASYRRIDEAVGRTGEALKKIGRLQDTLLIFASDHGLTETHTHFDLVEFVENRGLKTFHYPRISRNGFDAVVMESGNGMANVYLKNCDGWSRRTHHDEIRNIAPDLITDLVKRDEVAWIASKDQNEAIRITGPNGEAKIKSEGNTVIYSVEGEDPSGYDPLPERMTHQEVLQATFDTEHPDSPIQLLQIFKSKKCGDIVLSANKGFDLRRAESESPEHKSSHGSMHKEHMHVPFLINYKIKRTKLRTADIFPSILKLMGKKNNFEIDGEAFV